MWDVGEALRGCKERDAADPSSSFIVIVGDANLTPIGEPSRKVGSDATVCERPRLQSSSSLWSTWRTFMSEWIELCQPYPTHFSSKSLSCSNLDRCWVLSPASVLLHLQVQCQ